MTDVLDCKAVIEKYADKQHKQCKLLIQKWQILREIVYVLQIPLRATVAVQRHDLTLSDVFGVWKIMELHLAACKNKSNYKTSLAKYLCETVEGKKDVIYSNPFMTCAIFLDPRFRNQITSNENKCEEAKRSLSDLWNRINYGNEREEPENPNASSDLSFDFDAEAELNTYLHGNSTGSDLIAPNHINIDLILDLFQPEILASKNSILEYWENAKTTHPELYKLAMLVYSVPPTEVTIERDFSHLNHVFNNKRGALNSARLNDIMIMNLNKEMFHKIKGAELRDEIAQCEVSDD